MPINRRKFLAGSGSLIALGSVLPATFVKAVYAEPGRNPVAYNSRGATNPTIVVIELNGGNDGANTVIPYDTGQYHDLRPTLAFSEQQVNATKLTGLPTPANLALHPSMTGFKQIWDAGNLAIVHGVGYPNPNLSHFESINIIHSAAPGGEFDDGWLGRWLDYTAVENGSFWRGINVGDTVPLTLTSPTAFVPSMWSVDSYGLNTGYWGAEETNRQEAWLDMQAYNQSGLTDLAFVSQTGLGAYQSSVELQAAVEEYTPAVPYPDNSLANGLKLCAQLIDSSLHPQICYLTTGGFDTHSEQDDIDSPGNGWHWQLWDAISSAVKAFYDDIAAHGHQNDVIIYLWSEFGRRPEENVSYGTDHGVAQPVFVLGNPVTGGFYGDLPSYTNFDDYDNFVWSVDFRQIYWTLLHNWFGADDQPGLLGTNFAPLGFLG